MPRKTKLRRRSAGYSLERHGRLLLTHDYFVELPGEHYGRAWETLRDELLPAWIEAKPGTRPTAWWRCDMPSGTRRERTDGGKHPFDDPTYRLPRELFRGTPQYRRPEDMAAEYETQAQFLMRLNLCSPAELDRLTCSDDDGKKSHEPPEHVSE